MAHANDAKGTKEHTCGQCQKSFVCGTYDGTLLAKLSSGTAVYPNCCQMMTVEHEQHICSDTCAHAHRMAVNKKITLSRGMKQHECRYCTKKFYCGIGANMGGMQNSIYPNCCTSYVDIGAKVSQHHFCSINCFFQCKQTVGGGLCANRIQGVDNKQ